MERGAAGAKIVESNQPRKASKMKNSPTRRNGAVRAIIDPQVDPPLDGRRFADRKDAGRRLAALLEHFRNAEPLVVGIPRGGVAVAAEVARALSAPLEIVVVRRVGAPGNPEHAIGALAEGGVSILDEGWLRALGLRSDELAALLGRARQELAERVERYRRKSPALPLDGRTVLLVDDGLATGHSARAAAQSVRLRGAARVVLAVPVAAPSSLAEVREHVDEIVCLEAPAELWAVGSWYQDFRPISDSEVAMLLAEHGAPDAAASSSEGPGRVVLIDSAEGAKVMGDLTLPGGARAVVAVAHGSGSSPLSARDRTVAMALNQAGIGTLLVNLLGESEELERSHIFNIPLLTRRLQAATQWLQEQPETHELPIGCFAAGTGAAAALLAAAQAGSPISAIVSCSGRPDLVLPQLARVTAPTLLIAGGYDWPVLELNREAQEFMHCPNRLSIVPRATHRFQEPGALEEVARLAIDWYGRFLIDAPVPIAPAAGASATYR